MKLVKPAALVEEFTRLEWPDVALGLGIVEIACAVIYAIPRTAVLGAILVTGYLGGAIATHVRIHDNFIPPVVMGVLAWLGLYLRDARLRALLPLRT
jgi:xanthine/uracil permease